MPETISFWWAAAGWIGSCVVQVFGIGWMFRGFKESMKDAAEDAADARELAQEAVALARMIRDADLLGIRKSITDVELDIGLQGAALTQMRGEHDEMRDLVMNKLPAVVEGAIKRAAEAASNAAWTKRRRH